MHHRYTLISLILTFSLSAFAQEGKQEVIIVRETKPVDYFSIRLGAWFPKDAEKSFKFNDVSYEDSKSKIDQSQAIGIDFHYRNRIVPQLFFDFSASGWYSSYTFKYTEDFIANPSLIEDADAWVALAPFTAGVSFGPLPDNPINPYAMVGLGAYVAVTGRNFRTGDKSTKYEDNETYVAFGYFGGAGLDFFLSPTFGLSLGAKYQFVNYPNAMFTGQKDFTGLQVTLGVTSAL